MSWLGIEGHDRIASMFARANQRRRLGGSFLFIGPEGVGKRTFAFTLAKTLLCHRWKEKATDISESEGELTEFQPCGTCPSCLQFGDPRMEQIPSHADFLYIQKPEDRQEIPLAVILGTKDQAGIGAELSKTPFLGGRKVAILDDADALNPEGANALLKTLEEPPPDSILILIGTSASRQLPTIRSRCPIIRFQPLSIETLTDLLLKKQIVSSSREAHHLALSAHGSISRAIALNVPELNVFRQELLGELSGSGAPDRLSARLKESIDSAGKEGAFRRRRLRFILDQSLEFFRFLILAREGALPKEISSDLKDACSQALSDPRLVNDPELPLKWCEQTLEAIAQNDRYITIGAILEHWVDQIRS